MRRLILLITLICFAGCTTLRPIQGTSRELQERINSAELLKPGDRVLIVTTDDKNHAFKVTEVGSGVIKGRATEIPVDQVASVKKREFSTGKTIALVALSLLIVGGLVGFAASQAVPAATL
jgi:hypothetical protein